MGERPSDIPVPSGNRTFHQEPARAGALSQPVRWALLLFLSVVLLYGPAVSFEFLNYDDPLNISENRLVTQFVPGDLALIWGGPLLGLYIPLTYTVWGLLGRLSVWLHPAIPPNLSDPAVFHGANIILHAGSVLAVFAILRLLLRRDRPAAFGALLFAFHPLQVEPVAWVSELKGLLAGLLGLLAIWQYLCHSLSVPAGSRPRRHYLIATILFLAALLAKPSAVVVPLLAAVLASMVLKRDRRQVALELGPWLLLAAPLVILTKMAQPPEVLNFLPNPWQRLLVAGDAITFYCAKLLWPFSLAPDYGRTPQEALASGWVYCTGLLPFAAAAWLGWKNRHPWLLAGALLFLAALLPVLGLIPFSFQAISTVADRYLYLAMLAPALFVGRLLCHYPSRRVTAIAAILLLFLALRGTDCLRYWHDSLTFNRRAVELNPASGLALNNLGTIYKQQGKIRDAMLAYQQAISKNPDSPDAYANLGVIHAENGRPEEARNCYLQALDRNPIAPARIYLLLGVLASESDHFTEALDNYHKALALDPDLAQAYGYLGILYSRRELFDEAIVNYRKAIELDPALAAAHLNLGVLYEMKNRPAEAVAAYRQAIRLQPDSPDAFNNLGRLLVDAHRGEEALPLLQRAVELAPNQANPANNLGLAYLNLGQPREAAEWFRRALALDPGFAPAAENLARAAGASPQRRGQPYTPHQVNPPR